jgi:hypothetical protein
MSKKTFQFPHSVIKEEHFVELARPSVEKIAKDDYKFIQ